MILLCDIGNSRIKWAYWNGKSLQDSDAAGYSRMNVHESLESCWPSLPVPGSVHVSSVADANVMKEITAWSETHWQVTPQFARVEKSANGVINSYENPERLGVDRWLAMIAAHHNSNNPVCVIDCGTAITIDVVDADGRHLGGVILPGLRLMQASLRDTSGALGSEPEFSAGTLELAQDTGDAIASGCRLAATGAITMVQQMLQEKVDDPVDYRVTGGDAENLMPGLSGNPRHEPHLVLLGLAIHAGVVA